MVLKRRLHGPEYSQLLVASSVREAAGMACSILVGGCCDMSRACVYLELRRTLWYVTAPIDIEKSGQLHD